MVPWNDLRAYIRRLPGAIQERIERLYNDYQRTGDDRFVQMIVDILEAFDDDAKIKDLVKRMR